LSRKTQAITTILSTQPNLHIRREEVGLSQKNSGNYHNIVNSTQPTYQARGGWVESENSGNYHNIVNSTQPTYKAQKKTLFSDKKRGEEDRKQTINPHKVPLLRDPSPSSHTV
jgi:hypothetical protein